MKMIVLKGY